MRADTRSRERAGRCVHSLRSIWRLRAPRRPSAFCRLSARSLPRPRRGRPRRRGGRSRARLGRQRRGQDHIAAGHSGPGAAAFGDGGGARPRPRAGPAGRPAPPVARRARDLLLRGPHRRGEPAVRGSRRRALRRHRRGRPGAHRPRPSSRRHARSALRGPAPAPRPGGGARQGAEAAPARRAPRGARRRGKGCPRRRHRRRSRRGRDRPARIPRARAGPGSCSPRDRVDHRADRDHRRDAGAGARMSLWRETWLVASKDLRIEARSRVTLYQVLPFGAIVVLLFAFALDPDRGVLARVAPGLFWIAVLLAALLAVSRSFAVEAANDARDGLRLSGLDGSAIFLGKATAIALELLALEVVLGTGVALLYDVDLHAPALLVLAAVAATAAVAAAGTLYGVLAAGLRVRETLVPVLLLPVVAP